MEKNSQQSLSERIQQQMQEDLAAAKSRTESLLQAHANSLQQVLDAELSTTKSGIARQREALTALHKSALDDERKYQLELSRLRKETLSRVRWLLSWPLLASALVSLFLLAGSSLWTRMQLKDLEKKESEHLAQIQRLTADFCRSPAGFKSCKTP